MGYLDFGPMCEENWRINWAWTDVLIKRFVYGIQKLELWAKHVVLYWSRRLDWWMMYEQMVCERMEGDI
jgi:hypothetical protein